MVVKRRTCTQRRLVSIKLICLNSVEFFAEQWNLVKDTPMEEGSNVKFLHTFIVVVSCSAFHSSLVAANLPRQFVFSIAI